jgi:hypothetical protein
MPPPSGFAFYDEAGWARVSPVLEFARGHAEGRYLVENQSLSDQAAALDGPYWLVTSDRGLRERAGGGADRVIGGGGFLHELRRR